MQLILSAEKVQPMSSAEKRVTIVKGGKTCKRCQARENMQLVSSVGKLATGAKRGKMRVTQDRLVLNCLKTNIKQTKFTYTHFAGM